MVSLIKQIEEILKSAQIEDYSFEARLLAKEKNPLQKAKKRASGYPLQYILGEWEFYGLPFKVGQGVLIPRADTEILVETLLTYAKKGQSVLDLCTGSGCIAITAAKYGLCATGVELSKRACKTARENALLNNVEISLYNESIFGFEAMGDRYDFIVSNPPYLTLNEMTTLQKEVTFEPKMALYGGRDGLRFYRYISQSYYPLLKGGGYIMLETGYEQAEAVSNILKQKYTDIKIIKDYNQNNRVCIARKEE